MFLTVLDTRHTLVVYAEVTSPVSLDPHASFSVWLVTHSDCPHLCQVHHSAGKCWHCSTIRLVPRHNDIWKYINKRNTPQQIFIVCLCAFAILFKFISDLYKICKDDIKLTSINYHYHLSVCVMSPHTESIQGSVSASISKLSKRQLGNQEQTYWQSWWPCINKYHIHHFV